MKVQSKRGFLLVEIMIAFVLFIGSVSLYAHAHWSYLRAKKASIDHFRAATCARNAYERSRTLTQPTIDQWSEDGFTVDRIVAPLVHNKKNKIVCFRVVIAIKNETKEFVRLESAFLNPELYV